MKLTKGMKKALSVLLSAAMVVTGVNVTTNTAKAADGDVIIAWTGTLQRADGGDKTDAAAETALNEFFGAKGTTGAWNIAAGSWGANIQFFNWPANAADPTDEPTEAPTDEPTEAPTDEPTNAPTDEPTEAPTEEPTEAPTDEPTSEPSGQSDAVALANVPSADKVVVKISGTSDNAYDSGALQIADGEWGNDSKLGVTEGTFEVTVPLFADGTLSVSPQKDDMVITKIEFIESAGGDDPTTPPVTEPEGDMSKFTVTLSATADGTSWASLGSGKAEVTADGSYDIEFTAEADTEDLFMAFLDTDLQLEKLSEGFKIKATKVTVNDTEYTLDAEEGYMTIKDGGTRHPDDPKDYNLIRAGIRNEYNKLALKDIYGFDEDDDTSAMDAFLGKMVPINKGDKVAFTFEVSGMDPEKEGTFESAPITRSDNGNYENNETYKANVSGGDPTNAPSTNAPSTNPPAGGNTNAPTKTPTGPGVTTPSTKSGVASPSGIKKITVPKAKKTVVVAPNKTVKVNFTKTLDPSTATKSAVVTASIKNKKVVASAKVSEGSTAKKGTVAIKAAKKATKGASTVVTLASKDAAGKAVSAKITVKIQNKVKKVKAAKKAVVIKKKGKTAKLVLKVTAENKKAATTDTVTAKSKVATIKSAKASKGKITVTLKGKKKGSQKVTFKVGKKKVKVKVTVKK